MSLPLNEFTVALLAQCLSVLTEARMYFETLPAAEVITDDYEFLCEFANIEKWVESLEENNM
jgi:hypothetical protein